MGIVFRQSAKTSIIVFIGSVLGAVIIWLSTKYIEDKHQFGFVQNLTNNAVTLSQVLLFGLNSTLAVYIQRFINNDRKRKLLLTICFAIPAILSVFAIGLYYLLRSWVIGHFQLADEQYVKRYYDLLPVYVLLFLYQVLLEQYLGSQMKVAMAAFMREVLLRFINIALLLLYGFQMISFHYFVSGMVLMYIVPVAIFLLLSMKTKAFGFSLSKDGFTKAEYTDIIHFSWYHFLLTMALMLMFTMDMLLLPFYDRDGFGALAVYRVAVFFISFLQLPSKALIPASLTVLAKAFAEEDLKKAKDIFIRSSINILIPSLAMALIICCNIQNAVFVIKNGYGEIVPVFLILIIGTLFNIATGMNDQVLSIA
ncbi:MAG TPA: hypothetical protein VK588_07085, partial [Chitinophagaceae bacterium]|nr:hypothetical protein [Chitinophagaceae bacterium]